MSEIGDLSNKEPLLSVIIPVYNVEEYLREALDSVRNQSYKNVEIIVVNDGSTDLSGEILQEYESKDTRFRVFHQANAGVSATRNRGLKEARGEIIYFFDSDDVLVEGTFQKVIHRMVRTNSQLVFFGLVLIKKHGSKIPRFQSKKRPDIENPITGKDFLHQIMSSYQYGAIVQKFFIEHSFLTKNRLWFDENYIHEDESFTIEALFLADRITSISEVMIKKRLHEKSIMGQKKSLKNVEGWARAIQRIIAFLQQNDVDPETKETVLVRLRQIAHTAIRTRNQLGHSGKPIEHYLPKKTQKELGFLVRVHVQSPFMYRVLKFINRKIG